MKRFISILFVATFVVLVSSASVRAQSGGLDGEYVGDGLKVTMAADGAGGECKGTIDLEGQSFPYRAKLVDGVVRGSFAVEQQSFPFTITPRGDEFVFESEGTTYTLRKAGGKAKNPLARGDGGGGDRPANPLERNDRPAPAPGPQAGASGVGGVGIMMDNNNPEKKWKITALKPGGPAEQSGVKVGETIVAVDGKPVDGMTMDQIGAMLRGPVGSTVRLATAIQFPGGGSAESEREIERAPLNPAPGPNQPGPAGAGGADYRHRSGLWTITAPGADWKIDEAPDGNTTKWMHTSGAMIFVTIAPNVPFKDADAFYQQGLLPSWKQSGVEVGNESRYDAAGAPGTIVQFMRKRDGVNEMGQTSLFVVNGTGVIFQLTMPESVGNQLNQTFDQVARSFKITAR